MLRRDREEIREDQDEEGRGAGQRDHHADIAEAQRQQQEDARVFGYPAPDEVEEAPPAAAQRAPVARSGTNVLTAIRAAVTLIAAPKSGPAVAQAELARDRDHAEADAARTDREVAGLEPRQCLPLSESRMVPATITASARMGGVTRSPRTRMASHAGDQRGQVVDRGRDRRAHLLDGEGAEEAAAGGPDEAGEGEVGDRRQLYSWTGRARSAADHPAIMPTTTLIQAPA